LNERDRPRSRRPREVRAHTVSIKRISLRQLAADGETYPLESVERPATRGDCQGGERPCPFVACKWNLYLDVDDSNGTIKLNFPDLEPDEMAESCALDIADKGGVVLDEVGKALTSSPP
jgi:hypothetical protein